MPKFDHEYYFVHYQNDDSLPHLRADAETATRPFRTTRLPAGQKPLVFHNASLTTQRERGIMPMTPPPDILFHGTDIVVKNEIQEKLAQYDVPNLSMHRAIYIDHHETWHENYWYLTFVDFFDCWDRKHSTYNPKASPMRRAFQVYTYSLDDALLDSTPLGARRLFKMGGTMDGMVVVHTSIADLFRCTGADVVPIADYGVSYP